MGMLRALPLILIILLVSRSSAFVQQQQHSSSTSITEMSEEKPDQQQHATPHHPFCDLPGDPSLILTTNVDLGDKKMEIMKSEFNC